MKLAIAQFLTVVLFSMALGSCTNGTPKEGDDSDKSADTLTSATVLPVKMEVKKYIDREEGCNSEDCTYIELQKPVVDGGEAGAMKKINTYIDDVYREAVKSRLAEPLGNASIETLSEAFIEGYNLFMMEFPDSDQKWYLEIDGTNSIIGPDFFTAVVSHDEYLGGAHGAVFTQLQSFDLSTGNMINVTQKYDADKLLSLAETKFREIHKLDSEADLNDAGFMFKNGKFALPENMGLTREGILMVYNSYEVASYAQGETRFTIPYTAINGNV